jgi:hypothetical protein
MRFTTTSPPLLHGPDSGVLWCEVTELAGETKPVENVHALAVTAIYTAQYPGV